MTKGELQRERIIQAGIDAWPNIALRSIARNLNISHGVILYYFDDADAYRSAVIDRAKATHNAKIISHLIVTNDPAVSAMADVERRSYLAKAF